MNLPALRITVGTLAALALIALSGCASLSEEDCRAGDWRSVGYRDGKNGYPLSRLEDHRKACSEYGVAPNDLAYRQARDRGLEYYCAPSNGLAVGRAGGYYAGVCPIKVESTFMVFYEAGRGIYEAQSHLDDLLYQERDAQKRRDKSNDKGERHRLEEEIWHLRFEQRMARDELIRREAWASQLRY